ncbi:unnamed protein product [Anisakis simplex]|uniref:DNMT1-RFD domain-containing protein n=1 Tax=Anisakis simplex TaxID=6269 RepID=A0A0M3JDQ2_ANISI|nr:unnamed protein product [Anisakis simplex]
MRLIVTSSKFQNPIENDPQPATLDDLAGYWALISMELEDLERLFNEADELRKNNWQVASTSDTKQQQQLSSVNKPSSRVRASESITNKSPATKSNRLTKTNEKEEKNAKNELKRANEAKRRRELIEAMRKQKEKMIKENNIPSGGFSVTTKSSEHFVC